MDISNTAAPATGKGGAGTSLEDNNIFSVNPTVYFEGMDPTKEAANIYQQGPTSGPNAAVALTATVAVGIVAVIGTASILYMEDYVLLGVFWLVLGGGAGLLGYNYVYNRQ